MFKITVDVDGMQCGMCENHVNEAVRGAFPVKKVSSSHSKKQTVKIWKSSNKKVRTLISQKYVLNTLLICILSHC